MRLVWGKDHEPHALDEYADKTGYRVNAEPFQFFAIDDHCGATPDAIVNDDGVAEVKTPMQPAVHVTTILSNKVPDDYEWQVHGHLLVTGREFCDFITFDPRIPEGRPERLFVIRVERDEEKLEQLRERIDLAKRWIDERLKMLEQRFRTIGKERITIVEPKQIEAKPTVKLPKGRIVYETLLARSEELKNDNDVTKRDLGELFQ